MEREKTHKSPVTLRTVGKGAWFADCRPCNWFGPLHFFWSKANSDRLKHAREVHHVG